MSRLMKLWPVLRLGPVKIPLGMLCLALLCGPASAASAVEEDVPSGQRFVLQLQSAVRSNDRIWLADHMRYPVRYHGPKGGLIRNRSAFISRYASIFSDRLKATVLAQDPTNLFENWQGIMIGSGHIWIRRFGNDADERYCIITINDVE